MILVNKIEVSKSDIIEICRYSKDHVVLRPTKAAYNRLEQPPEKHLLSEFLMVLVRDEFTLNDIKHYLISEAKKCKNPDDRVLDFEWFPNFEERERIVNVRKTKEEFDEETEDINRLIKYYEENNTDTQFLKDKFLERAIGTF